MLGLWEANEYDIWLVLKSKGLDQGLNNCLIVTFAEVLVFDELVEFECQAVEAVGNRVCEIVPAGFWWANNPSDARQDSLTGDSEDLDLITRAIDFLNHTESLVEINDWL